MQHLLSGFKNLFKVTTTKKEKEELTHSAEKVKSSKEILLAVPLSLSSDPLLRFPFQLRGGFSVKIKKGAKRITLFRFLLAKMVFDPEGIHLDEWLVLQELYFLLTESQDPSFQRKYADWLIELKWFFSRMREIQVFPVQIKEEHSEELSKHLGEFLPSRSAYFGLRGNRQLRNSWSLILLSQVNQHKRRLEKRVIGVGYKDKGSRRDPHDGSPDWREVCSHFTELEWRIEEELENPKEDVSSRLLQEVKEIRE